MSAEQFTLPPSPDELEDARERDAERDAVERRRSEVKRELVQRAGEARKRIPLTFRRPIPELVEHCDVKLRRAHGADTIAALFLGHSGCGKSTAAAVLVHRALNEYVHSEGKRFAGVADLVWAKALELTSAERRHPLGAGEPDAITRARTCGLLVFDDLREQADAVVMFHVLSHRYDACLPTIATSELTRKALTAHLTAAGVRRITEQHAPGSPVLFIDCHPPAKPVPAKPRTPSR
jgi:DNA replication protein DnaC